MGAIIAGFNLYWSNLFPFGNEKVDFHVVFPVLAVGTGIKVQARTAMAKHLCNNVFHQHSFVDIQFIEENRTIKFIVCVFFILESVRYK